MDVRTLKDLIKDLPDGMQIYVVCGGYSNFDFKNNYPYNDAKTYAIMSDGNLFIIGENAEEYD